MEMHILNRVCLILLLNLHLSFFCVGETSRHVYGILDGNLNPSISYEKKGGAWVVRANLTDKTQEEGFSYLILESNSAYDDAIQAYTAGYVEGYLTSEKISQMFNNTGTGHWGLSDEVKLFITQNFYYLVQNVVQNQDDPYWYQLGLAMYQIKGMEDAFQGKSSSVSNDIDPLGPMWMFHWQMADLSDIEVKFAQGQKHQGSMSCSGLVMNLGNDLIVSHATWGDYIMMLRIIKKMSLPFKKSARFGDIIAGSTVLYSSYPGVIMSVDDFYITNQKLAVLETTNGVQNSTLYDFIQPTNSVPYFLRVSLANRLSQSGSEWVGNFSKHNSGTYNNQWMIVDYKQFEAGKPISSGTLYVLEQLPGFIKFKDMSSSLMEGERAWTSYNIPYFPETQAINNYSAYIQEYGDFYSHDHCPRANIFKRELQRAVDVNSTIALMRFNDYENDPSARCNCTPLGYSAENGISARCDLNPLNGTYKIASEGARCHGATDLKVANMDMMEGLQMVAISGPTYEQQPVFDWREQQNNACSGQSHLGHPDRFEFSPVLVDLKFE